MAASTAYAGFHVDPANGVEVRFLALVGTVVLVCLAAIAPRTEVPVPLTCLLATLCLWSLPPGTVRAASFFVLLTAASAMTAWTLWKRGAVRDLRATTVAWAIAVQALFRPESYMNASISVDFLLSSMLAPAVAFLAVARSSARFGPTIWLGLSGLLILGRGVSLEAAFALAIIAAVEALSDKRSSAWGWALATAALAAGPAWDWWDLAITLTGSVVLALLMREVRHMKPVALVAAAALATPFGGSALSKLGKELVPALLILPVLWKPVGKRTLTAVVALVLASAMSAHLESEGLLGVGLVLLATTLSDRGSASRFQAVWLGALAIASALAAGYPWLRPSPFETAIGFWGLDLTWTSVLIVSVVFWSLVLVLGSRKLAAGRRFAVESPALCVLLGVLLVQAPEARSLLEEPVVLSAAASRHAFEPPGRIRGVLIDSYLSNSEKLPAGTPVAKVSASDGSTSQSFLLRSTRATMRHFRSCWRRSTA